MSRTAKLRFSLATVVLAASLVAGGLPANGAEKAIAITDGAFLPPKLTIRPGDTAIWVLARDAQLKHSITSDNGAFPEQEVGNDNQRCRTANGDTFDCVVMIFHDPGKFAYYCKYHGGPNGVGMSGVVEVTDPSTTSTSSSTTTSSSSTTTSSSSTTTSSSSTTTSTRPPPTTSSTSTTTTTAQPTTTTTRPTTTRTAPASATTTTTRTFSASLDDTPGPTAPPATTTTGKKKSGEPSTTTTAEDKSKAKAAAAAATTTTTAAPEPVAVDPLAVPEVEPPAETPTTAPPAVEVVDEAALMVPTVPEDKPGRDAGLLLVAGAALAVVLLGGAGYAWYHRSSRYLPA